MRTALAGAVCMIAFLAGCAGSPPPRQTDPKLLAREAYLNAMAEREERQAQDLRMQAEVLLVKAKEKDLKAMQLRKNARLASEGKVVDPEPEKQ